MATTNTTRPRLLFGRGRTKAAEEWAHSLTLAIHGYLSLQAPDPTHSLFGLHPTPSEQDALAEVVASLNQHIAGYNPQRTRELSRVWGLEERLTERALRSRSRTGCTKALGVLLYLHPTPACTERLFRLGLSSVTEVAFGWLLVALYTKPSQVVPLLKAHPHRLTTAQMERVVEALHLRSPIITAPLVDGLTTHNVELYLLYIAWAEGVGNPTEVAERLTTSPSHQLRTAAFNILLGEAIYPTI